jgi:hypothetical protein
MKVATCKLTIALFSKIGASVGNSKTWTTLPHQCISHWQEQINSSQLSTLASRYALNTNHQTIQLKPIQEQHAIGWKQGVLCYLSISWATARLLEYPRTTIAGAQNWVKTFISALRTLNAKMWDTNKKIAATIIRLVAAAGAKKPSSTQSYSATVYSATVYYNTVRLVMSLALLTTGGRFPAAAKRTARELETKLLSVSDHTEEVLGGLEDDMAENFQAMINDNVLMCDDETLRE